MSQRLRRALRCVVAVYVVLGPSLAWCGSARAGEWRKAGGLFYLSRTRSDPRRGADVKSQTRQALEALSRTLSRAGLGLEHVASVHVYLRDARELPALDEVCRGYWKGPPPARTVLVTPVEGEGRVEMTAIALSRTRERRVVRPAGWPDPAGHYSYAVRSGDTLFASSLGPVDPSTGKVVEGDAGTKTGQILANARRLLEAGGMQWADVVRAEVHLAHIQYRFAARDALLAVLPPDPPTRATVIAGIVQPDHGIEITLTAVSATRRVVVGTPKADGTLEPPSPHLSAGLRLDGRLYVSGLLGDPDAENHDVHAQSRQTVGRLERTLRQGGFDWPDVVAVTVYVTDRADVPAVERALGRALHPFPPAYSVVQVGLLRPAARVEIMLLAAR